MKKIFLASTFLVLLFTGSYGQWYVKKYNVKDINLLTKEQLQESWAQTRKNIGLNAIVAGTGTVILIINILAPFAPNDDPTWMESLFGYKWENDLTRVVCAGIIAAGTISFFTYLGRSARIKSVIRKNFPASGSLNISPVMVLNHGTKTYCPGFRLSFNF